MSRDPQISVAGSVHRSLSRRTLLAGAAAAGVATALPELALAAPGARPRGAGRFAGDPTTLVIASEAAPANFDPHLADDSQSILTILGVYEGLLALKGDQTDEYVGLLAESWESNADQSTWTFHIRPNVAFHDGSPCDANAIVESFKRYLTIGLGSGSTRIIPGPDAVSAPDAQTVVFTLGRPQPLFEAVMAGTYGVYVVNTKIFKAHEKNGDYGRDWAATNAEGAGTGPYKLTEFSPSDRVVLEMNDIYWGGWEGNHFEKVVIRIVPEEATRRQLLENGDVDLVQSLTYEDLTAVQSNPDLTITSAYSTRVEYFYLTESGPLATPAARQAMCYAFPYQEVLDGVYKGFAKPAHGICAESLAGYSGATPTFATDLTKAKELLTQAGVADGTTLELAYVTGNENIATIAQLFQANLQQLGISLKITELDNSTYVGILYGDSPAEERPNLMYWAWWPLYNDAWSHMNDLIMKESQGELGGNSGIYFNQQAEDLMKQAEFETDPAKYDDLLAQVQKIVSFDDPAAIYYAQVQSVVVTRKDVTGVVLNPINVGTFYFYQMSRTAA